MEWGEELHLEECTVPGPSLYTTVVVLVLTEIQISIKFASPSLFNNVSWTRLVSEAIKKRQHS